MPLVAPGQDRWNPLERGENFQVSKGLAGLDQHQVRTWTAWHRWVTLAMLVLAFLAVAAVTERAQRPPLPTMIPLTLIEIAHLTPSGHCPARPRPALAGLAGLAATATSTAPAPATISTN